MGRSAFHPGICMVESGTCFAIAERKKEFRRTGGTLFEPGTFVTYFESTVRYHHRGDCKILQILSWGAKCFGNTVDATDEHALPAPTPKQQQR